MCIKGVKNIRCMNCGHCIAACPTGAIEISEYDMSEVLEIKNLDCDIDPDIYLNHLKARRSIRRFTNKQVTKEQVKMIIDAGRFSPTGGNLQNVSYFVSQQDIGNFRDQMYEELKSMGEQMVAQGGPAAGYGSMWVNMYHLFKENAIDRLFFDAGTVIVVSSSSPHNAMIAAAHMETMIYSMGLGMLYSGFSAGAINHNKEIQSYCGMPEGAMAQAVLVVGEPDVKYVRTVPRKEADLVWK